MFQKPWINWFLSLFQKKKPITKAQILGNKGEKFAAQYLKKKGYKILCRNWRYKKSEIDIVASYENRLIFVEVKTRSDTNLHDAYFAVNKKKKATLNIAISAYLSQIKTKNTPFQLDIIEVYPKSTNDEIECIHHQNISRH